MVNINFFFGIAAMDLRYVKLYHFDCYDFPSFGVLRQLDLPVRAEPYDAHFVVWPFYKLVALVFHLIIIMPFNRVTFIQKYIAQTSHPILHFFCSLPSHIPSSCLCIGFSFLATSECFFLVRFTVLADGEHVIFCRLSWYIFF